MSIPETIKEKIRTNGYSITERYFVFKRKAMPSNTAQLQEHNIEWVCGDEDRDTYFPMSAKEALEEAKREYQKAAKPDSVHCDDDFFSEDGVINSNGDSIFIFHVAGSDHDLNSVPAYRGLSGIFEILSYDDAAFMILPSGRAIHLADAVNDTEAECMAYFLSLSMGDEALGYKVEFRLNNPLRNIVTGNLSFDDGLPFLEWVPVEWDSFDKAYINAVNVLESATIH